MVFVRDRVLEVVCTKLVVWEPFSHLMVEGMEGVFVSTAFYSFPLFLALQKQFDSSLWLVLCSKRGVIYSTAICCLDKFINSQNFTSVSL